MMAIVNRVLYLISAGLLTAAIAVPAAMAQSGVDTLQNGYELTESFSSDIGGDAEAFYKISDHSASGFSVSYSSTLGTRAVRHVRSADRAGADVFVLGFAKGMPGELPATTSLGISAAVLEQLRTTGQAPLSVMFNAAGDTLPGTLSLVEKGVKVPVIVDNTSVGLKVVHARGVFQDGNRRGTGDFYFINNRNNPLALQYSIRFSWERAPRQLRITRIVAGASQQAAMEQTLKTFRRMELYGIRFDFGKASIRPDTRSLIADIATTLKNNPTWTLSIQGHTDSLGAEKYNLDLSDKRAASVVGALVNQYGVDPARLLAMGFGESKPKASNDTLQGRALNRRVELVRNDK